MATSADYINQLKADKQTLVNNLVAKGVTATNDETFTTLVPKVADIQSSSATLGTKTITANGTYKAENDNLDGYSEVTVETSGVDINDYFVKKMNYSAFSVQKAITKLPSIDTSGSSSFQQAFNGCMNLQTIPLLNFHKVINVYNMFNDCSKLTNLGGFQNYGEALNTNQNENYYMYILNLSVSTLLTEQSLINVLTNLYDIKTKGVKTQTIQLGTTNLAKLTSTAGQAALTQAQNYGWTIS